MFRQDPSFDRFTDSPTFLRLPWLNDHFARMMVYSPYFDDKLPLYRKALAYVDAYAIKTDSELVRLHPEWLLANEDGSNMRYIPYNCQGGTCPQYAADISSESYRRHWIQHARDLLEKGYPGLWIDDVNLQFRVTDANGRVDPPFDRHTGKAMTEDGWREYMASFTTEIRRAFPDAELLHNSIWFAGPAGIRDADSKVFQQIEAADYINIERGVNDPGLTGGSGPWSLRALFLYVDRVHLRGRHVIIDDFSRTMEGRSYALAAYYLISDGVDMIGNQFMNPDTWWARYDDDLGAPLGGRWEWNGLLRRDFVGGMVLLNGPEEPAKTVLLPLDYVDANGNKNETAPVTLASKRGLIALRNDKTPLHKPTIGSDDYTSGPRRSN